MKKLSFISNLIYALKKRFGWCPEPPTPKDMILTKMNLNQGMKDICFVDKPKLDTTGYISLISMCLLAVFTFCVGVLSSQSVHFLITFLIVVMVAPVYYCWINTIYELSDSQLRIRSGFYKKSIDLESITDTKVDRSYSLLAIRPPAVKYRDRVWLIGGFGRIMITPDDPVMFVKELKKRWKALRSQEGSSVDASQGVCACCGKPISYGEGWTEKKNEFYHWDCYRKRRNPER